MPASILKSGIYLPRERLLRSAIANANAWYTGNGRAHGTRSRAGWDEDPITMAVAAARNALGAGAAPDSFWMASTTFPYADRLNAGIALAALGSRETASGIDMGGSARAASSAVIAASRLTGPGEILIAAAEHRVAPAGSAAELSQGDGAAAILIGEQPGIAEIIATGSITADFADHYRSSDRRFDYQWEERWLREEGHGRLLRDGIVRFMREHGLAGEMVHHLILPVTAIRGQIAAAAGISSNAIVQDFSGVIGDTRTAHPLLLLHEALCHAEPAQNILLTSFGSGADMIWLRTTPRLPCWQKQARDVAANLAHTIETGNYLRHLALNGLVERDLGIRAEADLPAAPTEMYRSRRALLGFEGGKCACCGQVQFPAQQICVNPGCTGRGPVEPFRLADQGGVLQSVTADHLTYCADPPARYGMVRFDAGGSLMMDITDASPEECIEGHRVRFAFRIRDLDRRRGNRRYFWKAVPERA